MNPKILQILKCLRQGCKVGIRKKHYDFASWMYTLRRALSNQGPWQFGVYARGIRPVRDTIAKIPLLLADVKRL